MCLASEQACMAPGGSPSSIPDCVQLPKIAVAVMHLLMIWDETPAPESPMETIPNSNTDNGLDMVIDNKMKALEAWTIQLSKANEPRYRGYQPARAYAIQATHPPLHTPMNFLPHTAPMGPTYYQPEPKYYQYPRRGVGLYIDCDKLQYKHTFCPNMHTDQIDGELHVNDCGRLTIGS